MSDTAIEKILKLLSQDNFSTQELSDRLHLPMSTVRATLSQLRHIGLVEGVPKEKRGMPFTLTQEGRDYIKKLKEK